MAFKFLGDILRLNKLSQCSSRDCDDGPFDLHFASKFSPPWSDARPITIDATSSLLEVFFESGFSWCDSLARRFYLSCGSFARSRGWKLVGFDARPSIANLICTILDWVSSLGATRQPRKIQAGAGISVAIR